MTNLDEPGSGASGASEPSQPAEPGVDPIEESSTEKSGTEVEAAEAESTEAEAAPRKKRSRGMSALRETVIVLGTALLISLVIKTFLVQSFSIPSELMEPTLLIGDRVLVSRLVPGPLDLHRGDVVVFVDPGDWLRESDNMNPVQKALVTAGEWVGLLPANTGSHLIKRVVGMPGDHVVCCNAEGKITVNDVPIDEPYVMPGSAPSDESFDVVVPEDKLWVLGDNRSASGDSRAHMGSPGGGFVSMDGVVGVAQVRMWPLDRLGILRNPGATFEDVPDPAQ
ncbi:signal peptidase I [Salana multivorans]